MSEDLEIVAKNGKIYKSFRAYHIAIGHAVRQALLDFYKDIKQYVITEVSNYYAMEFHGSEYYENTYDMLNALMESDDVNGAITYMIKGNWEGNATFDINIDWTYLDAHSNGEVQWGTYTSLNGDDVTEIWEDLLEAGLPKGIIYQTGERHPSFNLQDKIEKYINDHLKEIVDKAIKNF